MFKEFEEFAMRDHGIEMAVGIIVCTSLGSNLKFLVDDVLMSPVGLLLGNADFSDLYLVLEQGAMAVPCASLAEAKNVSTLTIHHGLFVNSVISFLIVASAVFMPVRKLNKLKRETPAAVPVTKECPHWAAIIPIKARGCPSCASTPES